MSVKLREGERLRYNQVAAGGKLRANNMKHLWIDTSGNDRPFRRFRRCENCGVEQERITNYDWMRVTGYQWWPLVGRCKPTRHKS